MDKTTLKNKLKLATHNPTFVVLLKTVRIEIKMAFWIALTSIFFIKLCPDLISKYDTFLFMGKDVWEKICYSIVASTVFYFINQHVPKLEKKVSCYYFEVNNVKYLISEIKDLLDRPAGDNINPKTGTYPESIYAMLDLDQDEPPLKINESQREFPNWNEYITHKTKNLSSLIYKMLPLHEALERSTLEYLFKIEDVCYRMNRLVEDDSLYFQRFTIPFTDLMYCMVGLSDVIDKKYKHTKAINDYRDKKQDLKYPFPQAFDYKLKYRGGTRPKLDFNETFLVRLRNLIILICILILIVIVLSEYPYSYLL